MTGSIESWSTTASDNDDADGDINWAEGQNSKTVNGSARQMMGRIKEWLNDMGGQGTVGGTANAITLTLNSSYTALADGLKCVLQPTADNTDAVTLNVNSIGAKAIRKIISTGEAALASGDLLEGGFYLLIYDSAANSSSGAWICLNPTLPAFGTAATKDTGTSGTKVPLLDGANTWSAAQTLSDDLSVGGTLGVTGAATLSSTLAVTGNTTVGGIFTNGAAPDGTYGNILQGKGNTSSTYSIDIRNSDGTSGLRLRGDNFLFSPAIYGFTSAAAANVVIGDDNSIARSTSALKYKIVKGAISQETIDKAMTLRGFVYAARDDPDGRTYIGMAADDAHDAGLHDLVSYGPDGDVEGLMYERFVPILIQKMASMEARIIALEAR